MGDILRSNRIIRHILGPFAALVLSSTLGTAETFQLPGSRVVIDAPEGFAVASGFVGLQHTAGGASIVIADFPAVAFAQLKSQLTPEALIRAKFVNAKPLRLARTDDFVAFEGKVGGTMTRFMLVFADSKTTALLTVNIPDTAIGSGTIARRDVERALETVAFKDIAAAAEKSFTLGYTGAFKHAGDFNMVGRVSIYNLGGKMHDKPVTRQEPGFVILQMSDAAAAADLKATSRRLLSTRTRRDVAISEEKPVTVSGLDGWEHVATASETSTDEKIGLYEVMLADGDEGLISLSGSAPIAEFDQYLPEFRKIVASFQRRR